MRNAIFLFLWLLFYLFFWREGFGFNLIGFALLLHLSSRIFQEQFRLREGEWSYVLAFLLSAFGLIYLNSALSITSFILINVAYLSFIWGPKLSVSEHFVHGFIRIFNVRQPLLPGMAVGAKGPVGGAYSVLRLVILPLVIFLVFFALFRAGNPIFKDWSNGFTTFLTRLFKDFSWELFWFLLLGLTLVRSVLLRNKSWPLSFRAGDFLKRGRKRGFKRSFRIVALRREYRMALMVFSSLNILLLIVNLIDIRWYWFGFEMPKGFSLKEFLHEGVAYLIATLILAATVVFYYFRYNLNFYPKNRVLKLLSRIWIIQNAILAISVLLRTYYYIDFHGLANGRIIVITIISIVLFGLVLLYKKVGEQRSHAYVFRNVSLFVMLLLGAMSVWDWDGSIARYNLQHGRINEIDVDNYLRLHPRVYPDLYANLDRIEAQINAHNGNEERWIYYSDIADFQKRLDELSESFLSKQGREGYASWNYADLQAQKQLKALINNPE